MEVTNVSSSPTSPTEGPDLCEIDVTNVAIHSVTLLICLCGLAGNGAVIWLLGFCCSSRNCTIKCIIILTFLDFLFLLYAVPSNLLYLLENMSCSVIMPLHYVWLLFWMPMLSYILWLYLLIFISIQRCRAIICPLWHCCLHRQHLYKVICALLGPFCITVTILLSTMLSLCSFHLFEYCWVAGIPLHVFSLLLCAAPILISSTILFIKVMSGSHQQQPKRLDIVICLTVLVTLPLSLYNFLLQELGYTIVLSHIVFLLICITSSIKPFIYFLAGTCCQRCSMGSLRLSLQRVFEEPEGNTAHHNDATMETAM